MPAETATLSATDTPEFAPKPDGATAALVLADGTVLWGRGAGAEVTRVGEVCFNTAITGYQEILTDPSYAGQMVTFTFPHIGNVGANLEDVETTTPAACGAILRADITEPSNFRAVSHLDGWLKAHDLPALTGVDTRRLSRRIRDAGAPNAVLSHNAEGVFDLPALWNQAREWPGLEGMDLAKDVSCTQAYQWEETRWVLDSGYGRLGEPKFKVVAIDFGIKRNILRCLATLGCAVTVLPATATAEEVLSHKPDGVFLSNGPGDPAATGVYAVPMIQGVLAADVPVFGICLGHQMLALALGAKTKKMHLGHHGANHPIKDLTTQKVEITSQNHGFVVDKDSLPANVEATHFSLFDGTLAGIRVKDRPIFSVQYHPEASPGPQDSHYLFQRFVDLMAARKG
ncbi:MAG: glutamine-hydrolyzing carbamoyl-phosphate synthase small subunit [Alphaproteobacteria bacterium]|uniref:glutamine-hydrolyzing carbamoyl-phosphate synthase small subunit n=1 Tax=Pacificispira sp. TaxID=2888761 RepID=UPI001B0FFAFF|nr:glutamine-hydrolyzing carbamoyl-phosphate synthase small subunit [Alphaproteobacteria bacterium]MBO6862018.1 glutamine-hydrolyzing carbamoyl-phosphate synthase small subunit [Alphaproteobacteria bacterium]